MPTPDRIRDPRETHDDLVESGVTEELDPAKFEETREMEAFRSGWVAVALTRDEAGRVLFVREAGEGWLLPGGTVEPGESLREAARREVREETGVEIQPERPHAVGRCSITDGDREATFHVVVFEAHVDPNADSEAAVTDDGDLGEDDEELVEARWHGDLPDDLFQPELTEAVWERVVDDG